VVVLTGTVEEIAAAEAAAQVAGSLIEPDSAARADDDYEVGHAAQIIAYSPDDQAHVVYPFGVRSEDWVRDLPRLQDIQDVQEAGS
jgi:cytochrome oxidase Cu insertion factor (SCO1/SenC/PrrC family)